MDRISTLRYEPPMETFLDTGSGSSSLGAAACWLGRLHERLTMMFQLTETEQVRTRVSPAVTWLPEVLLM